MVYSFLLTALISQGALSKQYGPIFSISAPCSLALQHLALFAGHLACLPPLSLGRLSSIRLWLTTVYWADDTPLEKLKALNKQRLLSEFTNEATALLCRHHFHLTWSRKRNTCTHIHPSWGGTGWWIIHLVNKSHLLVSGETFGYSGHVFILYVRMGRWQWRGGWDDTENWHQWR